MNWCFSQTQHRREGFSASLYMSTTDRIEQKPMGLNTTNQSNKNKILNKKRLWREGEIAEYE